MGLGLGALWVGMGIRPELGVGSWELGGKLKAAS